MCVCVIDCVCWLDDVVMGTLTVRENFQFSAALRLPSRISQAEREARVDQVVFELGLGGCADTKVWHLHSLGGVFCLFVNHLMLLFWSLLFRGCLFFILYPFPLSSLILFFAGTSLHTLLFSNYFRHVNIL